MSTVKNWFANTTKSLQLGLIWLFVLFIIDVVDGIFLLQSTTSRIKADENIENLLIQSVSMYVGQMFVGYMLVGVMAGMLLQVFFRVWFPKEPSKKELYTAWVIFSTVVSVWWYMQNIVYMPALHTWLGGFQAEVGDFFDPWQVNSLGAVLGVFVLWKAHARWKGEDNRLFWKHALALPIWASVCVFALHNPIPEHSVPNKGPNLLIIGVDALRPDHLKRNGYFRNTAPNLEALLQESVVFTNAFTAIARTYPSWVSILTGRWPINNGIRDNLPHPDLLVPSISNFAQEMKDAGWTTNFITDDSRFSYMVPKMGFDFIEQPEVSLTNFSLSVTEPRFRIFHGFLHNPLGFMVAPVLRHNQGFGRSYRPELFKDTVVDMLAESSENNQFMMAVHSCVLHAPGDRNYPWSREFDQRYYTLRNRFRYSQSGSSLLESFLDKGKNIDDVLHQDQNIYDSGLLMADDLIGDMVAELKRSGLWDNTIIVLLSDHGEEMFAQDLPYKYQGPNHGYHPYGEGQHHVMLAIRFPENLAVSAEYASYKGTEISDTVRLIDLAPTIAELFSLEWNNEFDGASLLPLIKGAKEPEERLVYIETGVSEKDYWQKEHRDYPFPSLSRRYGIHENGAVHVREDFMDSIVSGKDRVVQRGKWKLVWRPTKEGGVVELYDRHEDPHNRVNLAQDNPLVVAELGMYMSQFLEQDGEVNPMFAEWKAIRETGVLPQQDEVPVDVPVEPSTNP